MMPRYSCSMPGMKPGTSTSVSSGMLKALQKRMKRPPCRRIDVERAREHSGLVGDDADRAAQQPAEADHDVGREVGLDLQEIPLVDDAARSRRGCRSRSSPRRRPSCSARDRSRRVVIRQARRVFQVVRGQEAEQPAAKIHRLVIVLRDEVNHARSFSSARPRRRGPRRSRLAGDLLDDLRAR